VVSVPVLKWYSESILNGDPHVESAVMFGRGRFNPGVIIDPKPKFAFDPEDQEKLAEFRNRIWYVDYSFSTRTKDPDQDSHRPTIVRMNEFAPQHSRVFKEVCNPSFHPLGVFSWVPLLYV